MWNDEIFAFLETGLLDRKLGYCAKCFPSYSTVSRPLLSSTFQPSLSTGTFLWLLLAHVKCIENQSDGSWFTSPTKVRRFSRGKNPKSTSPSVGFCQCSSYCLHGPAVGTATAWTARPDHAPSKTTPMMGDCPTKRSWYFSVSSSLPWSLLSLIWWFMQRFVFRWFLKSDVSSSKSYRCVRCPSLWRDRLGEWICPMCSVTKSANWPRWWPLFSSLS